MTITPDIEARIKAKLDEMQKVMSKHGLTLDLLVHVLEQDSARHELKDCLEILQAIAKDDY